MIVTAHAIVAIHHARMRNDPEYRTTFLADVRSRLEGFQARGSLPHPVIAKAIEAVKEGNLEHAAYLIQNDADKFDRSEREWLRENGFVP